MNEGEQPLLLDIGRTMAGELVKPDLQTGPDPPAPALQAIAEPPEPPDMQQLWEDLEMLDNMFLRKDPLLKKEVWKLIYEYRDIFSNTTPGCTDMVELQLRLKPAHPAKIPEFEPQTGSGTGSPTRDLAGRGCHRTFKFCLEQSPGAHKEEGREHAMGRGLSGVK